ncbi:hypothetical protein VTP01DRAFT_10779 [Rhizomucor pusillus]|uniref:uncharacterized protein n=1 Tax=Rhizomucor pusillus TaxID=4840 RepID=UPI003743B483
MDTKQPSSELLVGWSNVCGSSLFVAFAAYISRSLELRLEIPLIVSALRCVCQLTLMGLVLDDVLHVYNPKTIALLTGILIFLGTYEIVYHRSQRTFRGLFPTMYVILLISTVLVSCTGVAFSLQSTPFWTPTVFIPVLGMLLGNSMGSIAMAIRVCVDTIHTHGPLLESKLAMGASRYEAVAPFAIEAIRTAMLPQITQLSVMGMINIPGMMTGQILAGSTVQDAVIYQECLMFMVTASCVLGVCMTVSVCMMRLVDSHHSIRADRIKDARSSFFKRICAGFRILIHPCTCCFSRHRHHD